MTTHTGSPEVTLTRDRWGIGHIDAPDALAAFRAQGWLAAADRLWQMEWDRLRFLGRWAEVAGPAAVAEDVLFRRVDLAGRARQAWGRLNPETRAMTEAYADGVNGYLATLGPDDLPAEFEAHPEVPAPWEPWHCVALYQLRHFFMGTFHRKLWRGAVALRAEPALVAAMVGTVADDGAIVPGLRAGGPGPVDLLARAEEVVAANTEALRALPDADGGSNSWAVHGSRTATGGPLLAGDPHRGIEFPNVYHQCHLRCDEFDVIGLAFPGVPGFPHFGHNAGVAWCITHGMADDTDVFVEHGPFEVTRHETVAVRDGEPVTVACADTPRGPVALGDPAGGGPALALAWTAWHGTDTTFDALWPMLRATDCDTLEAGLRPWVVPVNNVLTADTAGNISFKLRGRVVERPPANRWTPVPGDAAHAWDGLEPVAFDRLHHWRNPDRGHLVTANNRTGDEGPYVSLDFAGPARHDRIGQLLDGLPAATADDLTAIHLDTVSLVARRLRPLVAAATPDTGPGRAARDLVEAWDGDVTADSAAATVVTRLRLWWTAEVLDRLDATTPRLMTPGFPSALFSGRASFEAATRLLGAEGDTEGGWRLVPGLADEGLAAVLGRGLDQVAAELASELGAEPSAWRWDRVHTMVSPHPLASVRPGFEHLHPPVDPCPGDGDTVRAGSVNPVTGARMATGSVARYLFDPLDWDRSGWVVPHGVSGVRGSGNDLDQRPQWLAGELIPMAFSPEAVAAVAVSTTVLTDRELRPPT